MTLWGARVSLQILLASFPGIVSAQVDCGAIPQGPARLIVTLRPKSVLSWTIGSCPLPERARNQTPRGIGQLPEQTLRNTKPHRRRSNSDYSRATRVGSEKLRSCAPYLLSTWSRSNPERTQSQRKVRTIIATRTALAKVPFLRIGQVG